MTNSKYIRPTMKADKYVSHRFPFASFNSVAYNTDAPPADKRTETELLAVIDGMIEKALKTRASVDELAAIRTSLPEGLKGLNLDAIRAMADDKTGVMTMLANQGLQMTRMQSLIDAKPVVEDLSIRAQVAKWQDENKATIEKIKNREKVELPVLNIRVAASPMTVATVNAGNSPYIGRTTIEDGINDFLRAVPTFWNFLKKGRTNSPTYGWVNKTNPQGAAAFIGPGVAKPAVSFALEADLSVAKKIADSAKTTTELLQDIDGMVSFIEDELRYQVMIKVNSTLMNSVGSSTVPTGIRQLSTAWPVSSGLKTTNPNTMDALRSVVGYLRSGYLTGEITIFMNSIDIANMDMAKATTAGVYMLPAFMTADGRTVAGARVVEDNNVDLGFIQAGFMRFYRILIYKDFDVSWGWENDDFTKNLVTAVGEMRLHQFFNQIHTGAFIYDSIENIKTEITEVVAP